MKKRLNTTYYLREDAGYRDNEEGVPSTVSRPPGGQDGVAGDWQSGNDGTAEPALAVMPKHKSVAWMKVSVRMTAPPRPETATLANAVSQGMKNKSARGSTPVMVTTSVKPSTSIKSYTSAKPISPMKASTPVKSGKPGNSTRIVTAGTRKKASTSPKGTTPVKLLTSAKLTTVVKPKSKGASNSTMSLAVPVAHGQAGGEGA